MISETLDRVTENSIEQKRIQSSLGCIFRQKVKNFRQYKSSIELIQNRSSRVEARWTLLMLDPAFERDCEIKKPKGRSTKSYLLISPVSHTNNSLQNSQLSYLSSKSQTLTLTKINLLPCNNGTSLRFEKVAQHKPPMVVFRDDEKRNKFITLMGKELKLIRFLSRAFMTRLGLQAMLLQLFAATGFPTLFGMIELTYASLTLEFLSSLTFHRRSYDVKFKLMNQDWELKMWQFGDIFRFSYEQDHELTIPESFSAKIV